MRLWASILFLLWKQLCKLQPRLIFLLKEGYSISFSFHLCLWVTRRGENSFSLFTDILGTCPFGPEVVNPESQFFHRCLFFRSVSLEYRDETTTLGRNFSDGRQSYLGGGNWKYLSTSIVHNPSGCFSLSAASRPSFEAIAGNCRLLLWASPTLRRCPVSFLCSLFVGFSAQAWPCSLFWWATLRSASIDESTLALWLSFLPVVVVVVVKSCSSCEWSSFVPCSSFAYRAFALGLGEHKVV